VRTTLVILCVALVSIPKTIHAQDPSSPKARPSPSKPSSRNSPPGIDPVNHVLWIIQENHSLDNYFETLPGADFFGAWIRRIYGRVEKVELSHRLKRNRPRLAGQEQELWPRRAQ
jgi:phospholipase C